MTGDLKTQQKKTNVLGLYKLHEKITVLEVAEAFKKFAEDIVSITISKPFNGTRTAYVAFSSSEKCEKVKSNEKVMIKGASVELQYANKKPATNKLAASSNKLYVNYPSSCPFEEVSALFAGMKINKPDTANSFCFVQCKDIDEQCEVVKKLDQKNITGGKLHVKIAIDKVAKTTQKQKKVSE